MGENPQHSSGTSSNRHSLLMKAHLPLTPLPPPNTRTQRLKLNILFFLVPSLRRSRRRSRGAGQIINHGALAADRQDVDFAELEGLPGDKGRRVEDIGGRGFGVRRELHAHGELHDAVVGDVGDHGFAGFLEGAPGCLLEVADGVAEVVGRHGVEFWGGLRPGVGSQVLTLRFIDVCG